MSHSKRWRVFILSHSPSYARLLLSSWKLFLVGFLIGTGQACAAKDRRPAPVDIPRIVGEYYQGDGHLTLNTNQTFIYDEYDDTVMHARWSGSFQLKHNVLTLHPWTELSPTLRQVKVINSDGTEEKLEYHWHLQALHCIVWGKRLYLLSAQDMLSFCNDINLGCEPRGSVRGTYLVCATAATLHHLPLVRTPPLLPAPWNTFVLPKPVVAKVLAVEPTGRREKSNGNVPGAEIFAVTLNKGTRAGLKPGMLFTFETLFIDGIMCHRSIVVHEVRPNKCIAEWVPSGPVHEIKVGTHVWTQLSKTSVQEYQSWSQ